MFCFETVPAATLGHHDSKPAKGHPKLLTLPAANNKNLAGISFKHDTVSSALLPQMSVLRRLCCHKTVSRGAGSGGQKFLSQLQLPPADARCRERDESFSAASKRPAANRHNTWIQRSSRQRGIDRAVDDSDPRSVRRSGQLFPRPPRHRPGTGEATIHDFQFEMFRRCIFRLVHRNYAAVPVK